MKCDLIRGSVTQYNIWMNAKTDCCLQPSHERMHAAAVTFGFISPLSSLHTHSSTPSIIELSRSRDSFHCSWFMTPTVAKGVIIKKTMASPFNNEGLSWVLEVNIYHWDKNRSCWERISSAHRLHSVGQAPGCYYWTSFGLDTNRHLEGESGRTVESMKWMRGLIIFPESSFFSS